MGIPVVDAARQLLRCACRNSSRAFANWRCAEACRLDELVVTAAILILPSDLG